MKFGNIMKHCLTAASVIAGVGGTVTTITNVVEQYNYVNVHEITESDQYLINGSEVTEDEWNEYINNHGTSDSVETATEQETAEETTTDDETVLYAEDTAEYYTKVTTVGNTFKYLAVYNCSDNPGAGCYSSYVLGAMETVDYYGDILHNVSTAWARNCKRLEYLNYSCYKYAEDIDWSTKVVDCTNRTAPGDYYGKAWKNADYGIGIYILVNATVQAFHDSTMCTYGGTPVGQTVISYEEAYTTTQFANYILEA